MDWKTLFFSPAGRIGRKSFWIAQLSFFVAAFVVAFVTSALATLIMLITTGKPDGAEAAANWAIFLLLTYPGVCVMTKRLHDLNHSGWWQVAPIAALVVLGIVALALGVGDGEVDDAAVAVGIGAMLLGLGYLAWTIWVFFFPGTRGPNRFGDPDSGLRKAQAVADVFS